MAVHKITYVDLEKTTGIAYQQLNRYGNGINEPKASQIAKIANGLGVSADYLLGLTDVDKVG